MRYLSYLIIVNVFVSLVSILVYFLSPHGSEHKWCLSMSIFISYLIQVGHHETPFVLKAVWGDTKKLVIRAINYMKMK